MALALSTLTDLAIVELAGGTVDDRGEHLVVRSPENPTFFWGNFVQVLDAARASDVPHWLQVFEQAFPDAAHRCFGLPASRDADAWVAAGFTCDTEETLVADGPPRRTPPPAGYVVRPLRGSDWDAYLQAELAENARTRQYDEAVHTLFLERRVASYQRLISLGHAEFLGAFHPDDGLVAGLGIVACPPILGRYGLARYQSVYTAPAHRRRGLASHLVGEAGAWADAASAWVICTETTNPAGRLYRAAGFVPGDVAHTAERVPPAASSPVG